jgi:hypothetical protein
MIVKWNLKGTVTTINQHIRTDEMTQPYTDITVQVAARLNKGIMDVEGNESFEILKFHTVYNARYKGKSREVLQNLSVDILSQNDRVAIAV